MEAPSRIGPYEIVREIGRGGMGIVYLAKEPDGGDLFALKVLPENWANDASRLERFQREAATVMKVRHPNIIPIYSIGRAHGLRFIAMKYIEGKPLDQLIREQSAPKPGAPDDATMVLSNPRAAGAVAEAAAENEPVPPSDFEAQLGPPISWCRGETVATAGPPISSVRPRPPATKTASGSASAAAAPSNRAAEPEWVYRSVTIVETIARALDHLHSRGITHRDVKPGNIIVDKDGNPWLADFGLVRDLDARLKTEAEGLVGTVQYIAPEQILCSQDERDSRSDLYSLGVTLYELVTLRRPFDGGDPMSILHVAASEAPTAPREINPRLSGAFENVIQKAMAKDPDARYQSGNDFADDLQRLRTLKPKVEQPLEVLTNKPWIIREPRFIFVTLFLVLLVVGLVEYCVHGALQDRQRLREWRADADQAFDRGDYREAADSYRLCLRLGGGDAIVKQRLRCCEDAIYPAPKRR